MTGTRTDRVLLPQGTMAHLRPDMADARARVFATVGYPASKLSSTKTEQRR